MADFIDVIKQLGENKKSQDAGFNRVEQAVISGEKGGLSPAQAESAQKKTDSETKKSQGYFANIGTELSYVNKNLISGFKSLLTPSGALGGLMALIAAPIFFIKGFLTGLLDSFKALNKLFGGGKGMRPVRLARVFFNRTLPNFFKGLFGKESKLAKAMASFKNSKFITGFVKIIDSIGNFFKKLLPSPATLTKIKNGFKFILQPFKMIGDLVKLFTGGAGGIGGALKTFKSTFSAITKFAGTIGRVLGRLFLPLTFIMTAFDTIMGAIDGFKGTDGNIVQKILGGLGGAIKGFMKLVTVPMDLVKSLISWIAGKFGFTEFEKLLDGFSFTESFGKAVDWLYVDLPAWFLDTFSWTKIKAMMSAGLDFAGEMVDSLKRLIHGGLSWIKSLFGFGDKGDFAPPEMPVTKDVRAFLTFDWVSDLLKPVTDFFKSIMDFDFMGFIKKIPGVGALLDYITGDDSKTNQDSGMKDQQERTKRMKELKKGLKEGSFDGIFTDSKDEATELKKLEQEEKDYFAKVRAGSADKGNVKTLKTANLAGSADKGKLTDANLSGMKIEELPNLNQSKYDKQIDFYKKKLAQHSEKGNTMRVNITKDKLRMYEMLKAKEQGTIQEKDMGMGNRAEQLKESALKKSQGGFGVTVVNNSTVAPQQTNNTSKTTTISPMTTQDPIISAAIQGAY